MGCGVSKRNQVAPANLFSLPSSNLSISSWKELLLKYNPKVKTIIDSDELLEQRLASLKWGVEDFGRIGYAINKMASSHNSGGTAFLSPTMRSQLWLACSNIDGSTSSYNSKSLWSLGWYDRALSLADQLEYAVNSAEEGASINAIFFDSNLQDELEDSTKVAIECVKSFKVIDNDVPRTLHNFENYTYPPYESYLLPPNNGSEQESLKRVLRAFVVTRPDINYTQGMNFVAALLLRILWWSERHQQSQQQGEEEHGEEEQGQELERTKQREILACGMLRKISNDLGMDEMWREQFPLLTKLSSHLITILNEKSIKLAKRLEKEHLPPSAFTTNWLVTLFTNDNTFTPAELLSWWDQLWVHFSCNVVIDEGNLGEKRNVDDTNATTFTLWDTNDQRKLSVEKWLLYTMERIMFCHQDSIVKAKDTVTVMSEMRRGLTKEEIQKFIFSCTNT
jgi:hypothetical protein